MRAAAKGALTIPQFRTLNRTGKGVQSNQELAEGMGVSIAAMSRMVDGLVKRGYLSRAPSETDRRSVVIRPTDLGRATLARIRKAAEKALVKRLDVLTEAEQAEVLRAFDLLERLAQPGGAGPEKTA